MLLFATFHSELFVFIFVYLFIFKICNFLLKMCNKFETVYCKFGQNLTHHKGFHNNHMHTQTETFIIYSKESILSKISFNF